MLDEMETENTKYSRKVANGKKVADAIISFVKAKEQSLECARVLYGS